MSYLRLRCSKHQTRNTTTELLARYVRLSLFGSVLVSSNTFAQHNSDLWIGVSAGRLAWQSDGGLNPGSVYHPLDPVNTFLRGWTGNDPGFDHASVSGGAIGTLPSGVEIWLEVVSLDPAFFAIDNAFEVLEFPGDAAFLGDSDLHTHITWLIDREDPAFDSDKCVWEATFILVDDARRVQDSRAFTLLFTNVPVRGGGFPPMPQAAGGDFDADQDVDLADQQAFSVCLTGPGVRPAPDDPDVTTCEVDCHNAFDFDDDMDTDLLDFAEFQTVFDP